MFRNKLAVLAENYQIGVIGGVISGKDGFHGGGEITTSGFMLSSSAWNNILCPASNFLQQFRLCHVAATINPGMFVSYASSPFHFASIFV